MTEPSVVTEDLEDYSGNSRAFRAFLTENGLTLSEVTADLKPKYHVVWRDIAIGYLGLLAAQIVVLYFAGLGGGALVWATLAGAVLIGFFMAYLQLFTHEAAHRIWRAILS